MKAMKPLNLLLALVLALALAGCDGGNSDYYPPPVVEGDPAGSWIHSWEDHPEYGTYGNYMDSVVECDIPAELSDQCFVDYLADQGVGIGDIIAVWTTSSVPYVMEDGSNCWIAPQATKDVYVMELNNGDFLFMEVTDDGVDVWGFLAYVSDYSLLEDGGNVDFGSVLAIEDCSQPVPYEANILLRLERGDVFTPNMCP